MKKSELNTENRLKPSELYLCSTTDFTLDRYDRDDQLLHAKRCEDTFRCVGWTGLLGDCNDMEGRNDLFDKGWVEALLKREELV